MAQPKFIVDRKPGQYKLGNIIRPEHADNLRHLTVLLVFGGNK